MPIISFSMFIVFLSPAFLFQLQSKQPGADLFLPRFPLPCPPQLSVIWNKVPKCKIPKETDQVAIYLKFKMENTRTLATTLRKQPISQSHSMLMTLNCSSLFAPLCQHLLEFQFKLKTKNNREYTTKLTKQNTC